PLSYILGRTRTIHGAFVACFCSITPGKRVLPRGKTQPHKNGEKNHTFQNDHDRRTILLLNRTGISVRHVRRKDRRIGGCCIPSFPPAPTVLSNRTTPRDGW